MPKRAPTNCRIPNCPGLAYEGGYCPKHLAIVRQRQAQALDALRRKTDQQRPSANRRGYTSQYRAKRKKFLETHPWCEDEFGLHPGRLVRAIVCDHRIPLRQGGKDDDSNYVQRCKTCHNHKTAHQDGGFGHRRGGEG